MKYRFHSWNWVLIIACFFLSCQKELSFENGGQAASGRLVQDVNGDCMPAVAGGEFKVSKPLGDSNYLSVSAIVHAPGDFYISSNTVNGFHFESRGVFSDTGTIVIKLLAIGTPLVAGTNTFTVSFDSSVCSFPVTVRALQDTVPLANYTLAGSPAACAPITIFGSYIKNIAMNEEDSVVVSVSVLSPGKYNLSTNLSNNIVFRDSGVFTSTGIHSLRLRASGTPTLGGSSVFTVSALSSQCNFTINVSSPVAATGLDYFPLTLSSYWTYDDLSNPGDTLKREVVDSITVNNNIYKRVFETARYTKDTFLFRRSSGNYYDYGSVDRYTRSLVYVPTVKGDLNFLKVPLVTGDKWTTTEYVGNLFSGQPVYTTYDYYCSDANYAITLGGKAFTNVYRILLLPQVRSSTINPYNSTGEVIELLYARGIGLIYYKNTKDGFKNTELQIRNWKVF